MRNIEQIIDSQIAPVGTFTVRRALPDSQLTASVLGESQRLTLMQIMT